MKRLVSVTALALAVLMLLLSFAACGKKSDSDDEDASISGTYKMTDVKGDNTKLYKEMMDRFTLEVKDNGDAVLKLKDSEIKQLQFDVGSGKVTIDGSQIPFSYDNDSITIEDGTGKMVFERK